MESTPRNLLLVTLALEDALARRKPHEVDCLLKRRQEILDRLEEKTLDDESTSILTTTAEIESRIIANLQSSSSAIANELRCRHKMKIAAKAYAAAPKVPRTRQVA